MRRAFTLIEVLVATAIFAIVLLAINTVFFAALRLRRSTTTVLEQSLPLNRALTILRRDLQNAVQPGGVLAGRFTYQGAGGVTGVGAVSSSSSSSAALTVAANSITAQMGGLDFFTTTGTLSENAPWGDIQEVNYQLSEPLDPSKALGKDLVRTVNRNLLGVATQTPESQHLAGNIESLDFSFYDGTQWRNSWDTSAGDTNLPLAVRVSVLQAVDRSVTTARQEPVQMVVLLDIQPTNTVEAQ